MANRNSPAGDTGGPTGAPRTGASKEADLAASLPTKLRIHMLARLLSVSSKEVLATLTELGVDVRSAQSSIDRETAVRAAQVLLPDPDPDTAGLEVESAVDPVTLPGRASGTSGGALAPVFNAPAPVFLPPTSSTSTGDSDTEGEEEPPQGEAETDSGGGRRRRRRGRRGRGRGKGGGEGTEEDSTEQGTGTVQGSDDADEQSDDGDSEEPSAEPTGQRRRRRRRRRNGNDDDTTPREDDPPDTVVHVRDVKERATEDEVQAVRGSTRLEAKRQRRRDGREAGRRRAPILSESEFLTRREAVARTMVVREDPERTQIGVLEDDVLVEHFVTTSGSGSLVGNVYLGKVQNVLPSMEAAFVDIGRGRNAVLYAGEVDWDAAGLEGKSRRIEQALSSGDSVLVQVTKDPAGHKGARLTTQISLPGRFLVYVPGGRATGISRKLPDNERKRLKEVLKRIVPDEAGVIIRTASEGVSEEELARDVRRLQAQWEVIQNRSGASINPSGNKAAGPKVKAPELLYEEPDLLVKVVRDLFTEDFRELVVQGEQAWDTVEGYVTHVAPDLMPRVRRYTGSGDVFSEFRIDEQITKALDRKVWLPSGGYLVIDRTEAMTVIDVNTGKFTGAGGNLEETVTRNNLEAAEEIIRQLRLRDIGGIIVIDFIDMVLESNRDLVLRRLTECLGRDRTRHQVAEVTSLGLVQMTRKKVGAGLLEAHSTSCEHCKGRGILVSAEPVNIRSTASLAPSGARDAGAGGARWVSSVDQEPEQPASRQPAVEDPVAEEPVAEESGSQESATAGLAAQVRADQASTDQVNAAPSTKSAAPLIDPMYGPIVNGTARTVPASEPVQSAAEPDQQRAPGPDQPVPDWASVQPEASVQPAVPAQAAVPAQPAPQSSVTQSITRTTRRRRVASRPAGPPTTEQPDSADSDAQVRSAVQQAG